MNYGKETVVEITDSTGSKMIHETNYFKGKPEFPQRITVMPRIKVLNQKQEQEEYAKFSDEIAKDPNKIDPRFIIERTSIGNQKGYYFVIPSYTILK